MRRYGQTRRRGWKRWLAISSGLVICGVGFFVWSGLFQSRVLGDPSDVDQIKRGWQVYAQACAKCHGQDLDGEFGSATEQMAEMAGQLQDKEADNVSVVAPAHDASGLAWRHSDQTLFEIIKFGEDAEVDGGDIQRMPAFKDKLSDDEIWMTIALIKSSWPAAILKTRDSIGVTGR